MHTTRLEKHVLAFAELDQTKVRLAGGKGANLGELSRIDGVRVPDGFCISTEAFARTVGRTPALRGWLERLSVVKSSDRAGIGELSGEIRRIIEGITIPEDIQDEVSAALTRLGDEGAYAVRSSATAEDLPTASFAGQQDTYLNVIGTQEILRHVGRCWASLFTDRAVAYRLQNGFDHRQVQLAVIVQRMIFPQAAGILFTADPVTSNRKVATIEASFGLGEALVSGKVNADVYRARGGKVIERKVSTKTLATYARPGGGTAQQEIGPERQNRQTLSDEQILRLERLGRTIEAHFGRPQDIEWCLADDTFYVVQSRPITTLYPIPEPAGGGNHVYLSVGHQQMMTDPMRPLGLSLFQLTAVGTMFKAGGRLFVDVTNSLASAASRENLLDVIGQSDPLMKDALVTLLERGDFIESASSDSDAPIRIKSNRGMASAEILASVGDDPEIVPGLIQRSEAALMTSRQDTRDKSGPALFDFILEDIQQLKRMLKDPKSFAAIMAGINASAWINENMREWLGEKNAADIITQSVPDNITSEMGMALLDVADVIRPYPDVIGYLQQATADDSLAGLEQLDGGRDARDAIDAFLEKYGMRCVGEIDITRPRWRDKPGTLVPVILGNVKNSPPGARKQRIEQNRREASRKERELLERLEKLPEGERKASETKQMIGVVHNFMGYREYPKYTIVNRYYVYRQALLEEGERLVRAGVIDEIEDIYHLRFEELHDVVRTGKLDRGIIRQRKDEYQWFERLTPPRVITSDGEIVVGRYKRENLPTGAIVGLPVSSGVVEGRARVVSKMEDADLEEGDILVTPFTDPSWTPLFVSIKGLVTEVGGLMTHGAVIAREYGLPAVVGVEHATRLIEDGQRIRVNGTDGYVQVL